MMTLLTNKKCISCLLVLLSLVGGNIYAQGTSTIYYMESIPQRMSLNPALRPQHHGFFSLGTNLSVDIANTFSLSEILTPQQSNGKTYIEDTYIFDKNLAYAKGQLSLFSFGFKLKKFYFSLSVDIQTQGYAELPASLIKNGNDLLNLELAGLQKAFTDDRDFEEDDFSIVIDPFTFESATYVSYNASASYELPNKKLIFGAKLHFLKGLLYFSWDQKKYEAHKTQFFTNISSELETRYSLYKLSITNDPLDINLEHVGTGLGADFGVVWKPYNNFEVSSSIINIGYLNWTIDQAVNIDATFSEALDSESEISFLRLPKNEVSTEDLDTNISKTVWFNPSVYLGAKYKVSNYSSFSAVTQLTPYPKYILFTATVAYHLDIGKYRRYSSLALSASSRWDDYLGLGIGYSYNGRPLQFYIMTDNIVSLIPPTLESIQRLSLRIGINFMLHHESRRVKRTVYDDNGVPNSKITPENDHLPKNRRFFRQKRPK